MGKKGKQIGGKTAWCTALMKKRGSRRPGGSGEEWELE